MSGSGGIVMSNEFVGSYAGDVDPAAAWESLASDPKSVLVDVRTRAEWSFVGLPTLAALGKQPITLEWSVFPTMSANPDFVEVLDGALSKAGFGPETQIFFLCRSGQRSRHAAEAMTAAGWKRCFNVAEGFEGGLDGEGHRGRVNGWKARGLPWSQT
jgi:rhodanese-related sulfurtransferase